MLSLNEFRNSMLPYFEKVKEADPNSHRPAHMWEKDHTLLLDPSVINFWHTFLKIILDNSLPVRYEEQPLALSRSQLTAAKDAVRHFSQRHTFLTIQSVMEFLTDPEDGDRPISETEWLLLTAIENMVRKEMLLQKVQGEKN